MGRKLAVLVASGAVLVAGLAAPAAADPSWFVSPLFGVDLTDDELLVADAGQGIVVVDDGDTRVVPLPGVTDVSAASERVWWATRGAGDDPNANTGQALFRVVNGRPQQVVDLFAFEAAENPDGEDPFDSNPFDVQALGRNRALVVDAGGNDLLRVDRRGDVEVLAVFPDELVSTADIKTLFGCPAGPPFVCGLPAMIPAQATPTSVAIGPDGHYYVGELKGFPAPLNESRVWRVAPNASGALCGTDPGCELVFDGGFTSIIDLAFDDDGNLLVAELDEASWAAVEILQAPTGGTINRCDLDDGNCEEVATGLDILTAIDIDDDERLVAAVNALIPGVADVIEIDDEDDDDEDTDEDSDSEEDASDG